MDRQLSFPISIGMIVGTVCDDEFQVISHHLITSHFITFCCICEISFYFLFHCNIVEIIIEVNYVLIPLLPTVYI